jgi:hypothetical protein
MFVTKELRANTSIYPQEIPGASLTATVHCGYDSDGNLAKLTYPNGSVIDYTYTARNQLWQVQNGGPAPVATYAYDLGHSHFHHFDARL